jgi:hypothetical protein
VRESNCSDPNAQKLASHSLTVGTAIAEEHTHYALAEALVVVAGEAAIAAVVVEGCRSDRAAVVDSLGVGSESAAPDLGLGVVDSWHNFANVLVGHRQLAFLPALS